MHPDRVARFFAIIGLYLLLTVLGLRLISLVNIAWKERMSITAGQVRPLLPSIGEYTISPDGRQVSFQRQVEMNGETGWFSMPIQGGPAVASTQPTERNIDPFQVRNNRLYLLEGAEYARIYASPRDSRVGAYDRSPNGAALAFAGSALDGITALYVMDVNGKLNWLGDHENITSIDWAPDNQDIAFIADSKGTNQVFITSRDGQQFRQITNDSIPKQQLSWSPDGRMLSYIVSTVNKVEPDVPASTDESPIEGTSTPAAVGQNPAPAFSTEAAPLQPSGPTYYAKASTVMVIDANGANPRAYLQRYGENTPPTWAISDAGPELLYTVPLSGNTKIQHLYAINPVTGQTRRVYPPQELQALDCPTTLAGSQPGSVKISIENSALAPADVHILLRARSQHFPATSNMNTNIIRSESITIPGGTVQVVEWPIQSQAGLKTYLSVVINPSATLPMDEERCVIQNVYDHRVSFLPNLPYLPLALPLSAVGLLLCVPWLRKQQKPALWVLYFAIPLLALIILFVESWIAQAPLT